MSVSATEAGINRAAINAVHRNMAASSTRGLDDHIRELCHRVVAAEGPGWSLVAELRAALREHNQRLRNLAARQLLRSH